MTLFVATELRQVLPTKNPRCKRRRSVLEEIDGNTVRIYEFDEQGPLDSEGHVVRALVLEGSQAEADELTETDAEDRNYLVPALIIALEQ